MSVRWKTLKSVIQQSVTAQHEKTKLLDNLLQFINRLSKLHGDFF